MKSLLSFGIAAIASLALLLGSMETASAKRLGGGGSFGSKFSQSAPVKQNSIKNQQNFSGQQAATPAQSANANRKQQLTNRGGLMGLLGGLAIGGLLGALFFGGAFENINFFDILIFAAIAFLLFKFMSSRARQNQNQPAAAGGYGAPEVDGRDDMFQQRNSDNEFGGSDETTLDQLRGDQGGRDFDKDAFLAGAEASFRRLQQAWDEGDLADIRQFTTDHVFGEIQDQYHSRAGRSYTEVLSLQSELLKLDVLDSKREAIVLFSADLREDGNHIQMKEVWHFVQPTRSTQPTWFLDGIQQVEE